MATTHRDDEDGEIDMEAERRLQSSILGLKQQADQLMMGDKFDDAIRLYRGLLVHLTKSQVKMATQKDLVISCRMNVLGAMSKLEQWRDIPAECEHVFAFLNEIKPDLEKTMSEQELGSMQAQILGRVFYFRGFALLRLGAFAQADHDFRVASQMLPNVEAIKDDWKQVQAALMLEQKVQELMNTAMGHFQSNNFTLAAENCKAALTEANKLEKHELTALIHGNLASVYSRAEKDDDAIEQYVAAIELTKKMDPANWNDRLFDLMEGVTSAYMRKSDVQAAYGMLKQSAALFPKCKDRQDREYPHFLNVGRVCFALQKFDEAEKHFIRAEKASSDVDSRLHVMSWLGKVYVELKEFDKLTTVLDRAFPITIKEKKDDMHVLFLLLWLPVLEERVTSNKTLGEADLEKLGEAYRFFGHKRLLNGLLRAGLLMVVSWKDEPKHRAKRDEVLNGLDAVQIEGLVGIEADLFSKLSMIRADVGTSVGNVPGAFAALKHALKSIKKDSSTLGIRVGLLRRFAFLYVVQTATGVQDDEQTLEFLDDSIAAMRGETNESNVPILSSVLVRVSQWELQKPGGNVDRADELLQESVKLLKSQGGTNIDELLCQTLVGQCVLELKRGNTSRAEELMKEVDSYLFTASWAQLDMVRSQLPSAKAKDATVEKEPKAEKFTEKPKAKTTETKMPETKRAAKPPPMEAEAAPVAATEAEASTATDVAAVPLTGLAAWWDEYWFAVSVMLVAMIFAWVMLQEETHTMVQEDKTD